MKKLIKTTALVLFAMFSSMAAAECAAQGNTTLDLKISNIKASGGNIMIAVGDYNKPMDMVSKMIPVNGEVMECVLAGILKGDNNLYIFHDVNGNFNLDMDEKGVPQEGCYSGKVEIKKKKNKAAVQLQYYTGGETGK